MTYVFSFPFTKVAPLALATLLLGVSACQREAVSANGAIAATILPAGQATQVTATDAAGQVYTALPDATTGAINLANLPAGTYTVTVATKPPYLAPAPQRAQVKAGLTTTLQYGTLTSDGKLRGTLSWTENGTRYTATHVYGEVSRRIVSLNGYVLSNGVGHEVTLVIPTNAQPSLLFAGVGTYGLGVQAYPFGKYSRAGASGPDSWYTPDQGAQVGHITVTQYDPAAFTLTGTFDFTAQPFTVSTRPPVSVAITNGNFTLTY
jgi:hypothetical protein